VEGSVGVRMERRPRRMKGIERVRVCDMIDVRANMDFVWRW